MVEINSELVGKLIKTQFPEWAHLPICPVAKGGWDNRTFHLGCGMSVRLPSAERYVSQVEKEQEWLPKLKSHISLPISAPLVKGEPGEGYPWVWSVNKWIEGDTANCVNVRDKNQFAIDLAKFLKELQSIDCSGGPLAGKHNFCRGGSLSLYNDETRITIKNISNLIDAVAATEIWERALKSEWTNKPVWIHGDIAPSNLLVDRGGKLCGVIDFGILGVGDPACDLAIAWTFFDDESREIFKSSTCLDEKTWDRGRGWALWKTLITYDNFYNEHHKVSEELESVFITIIKDFK